MTITPFAVNLQKWMNVNCFTSRELAKRTGVSEQSISRYLHGHRIPNAVTLNKIAKTLGTTASGLLTENTGDYLYENDEETDEERDFEKVLNLMRKNAGKWELEKRAMLFNILISTMSAKELLFIMSTRKIDVAPAASKTEYADTAADNSKFYPEFAKDPEIMAKIEEAHRR